MQDKDMVRDILSQINSSLTMYTNAIAQASNVQLRQTLQQIRNNDETFQFELYKLAEQKGFYSPAMQADQSSIMQVKSQFIS